MPVEDSQSRRKQRCKPLRWIKRRAVLSRRSLNRCPADLRAMIARIDPRSQCSGHQLRPQADAENRPARSQSHGNARNLAGQKRIIQPVVDPNGPAQRHQTGSQLLRLRQREMRRGNIDGLDCKASFTQWSFEGTEVLKGDMAQYNGKARGHWHRNRVHSAA